MCSLQGLYLHLHRSHSARAIGAFLVRIALARFDYWTWTFPPFLKEAREEWEKAGTKKQDG
ncbi:MAG: hypothetical protein NTW87_00410 [Planctomycetota bacterium]|nr:hypothetical protein [Planctomycetota bacterium]